MGIIIAVICSNWVSEAIHSDGIYETDLEADGSVIFLRPSPPPALFAKTAGQVASKPVWCAPPVSFVLAADTRGLTWYRSAWFG